MFNVSDQEILNYLNGNTSDNIKDIDEKLLDICLLKDYVSLYDYHLKSFFSSEMIRKNLQNKGFINSKGFIMYDPEHREIMREKNKKKKKKITDEEMKAKVMNSINGINVPSNIKDKEIDAKRLAEGQILPTESKLPMDKELITLQSTLFKKKKKERKKK